MLQKEILECVLCCLGLSVERHQQVSNLIGNHLEKLQNRNGQIFLPFQYKCITSELFLNLLIVRTGREKKGRRAAVLYSQDEFY